MKQFILACSVLVAAAASLPLGAAGEKIDYEAINKIKQQGMSAQTSQVMEISSWLTDVHGPRLTGSPNLQKAGEWAAAKMKEWGLQNVALEPWADKANQFPYGWTNDKFYLAAVSPQAFPIPGTPTSWTPGTNGLTRGEVALVTETTQEELQKHAGKLKGKWILTQAAPDVAGLLDGSGHPRNRRGARADGTRDGTGTRIRGRQSQRGGPWRRARRLRPGEASTATTGSRPKASPACSRRPRAATAST